MSSIWLGAIAGLIGVIAGAILTYYGQVFQWRRTTRRELYGSFVGRCNVCRDQLIEVAFAIRQKMQEPERNERWEKANAQLAEVSSLAAQVSMVATTRTRKAAEALENYLSDLKAKLHNHNRDGTLPERSSVYRGEYSKVLNEFIAAASKELGIVRNRRENARDGRASLQNPDKGALLKGLNGYHRGEGLEATVATRTHLSLTARTLLPLGAR